MLLNYADLNFRGLFNDKYYVLSSASQSVNMVDIVRV